MSATGDPPRHVTLQYTGVQPPQPAQGQARNAELEFGAPCVSGADWIPTALSKLRDSCGEIRANWQHMLRISLAGPSDETAAVRSSGYSQI
jgi:hypothetical protein